MGGRERVRFLCMFQSRVWPSGPSSHTYSNSMGPSGPTSPQCSVGTSTVCGAWCVACRRTSYAWERTCVASGTGRVTTTGLATLERDLPLRVG